MTAAVTTSTRPGVTQSQARVAAIHAAGATSVGAAPLLRTPARPLIPEIAENTGKSNGVYFSNLAPVPAGEPGPAPHGMHGPQLSAVVQLMSVPVPVSPKRNTLPHWHAK
jgi:hypothetical protein